MKLHTQDKHTKTHTFYQSIIASISEARQVRLTQLFAQHETTDCFIFRCIVLSTCDLCVHCMINANKFQCNDC